MEAFEEGIAAVGESDGMEQWGIDGRCLGTLHDYGGELLVVTDKDEFADGAISLMGSTEYAQYLWFQYLGGFVDDGYIEMFQGKQFGTSADGGYSTGNDTHSGEMLADLGTAGVCLHGIFEKTMVEALVAGQFIANAQVGRRGGDTLQHFTYLIYGTVGVRE